MYLMLFCVCEIYTQMLNYYIRVLKYHNIPFLQQYNKNDNTHTRFIVAIKSILTIAFLTIIQYIFQGYLFYKSFSFIGVHGFVLFLCYLALFVLLSIITVLLKIFYCKTFYIQPLSKK